MQGIMQERYITSKYNYLAAILKTMKRLERPLWSIAIVKWTLGLLCPSL